MKVLSPQFLLIESVIASADSTTEYVQKIKTLSAQHFGELIIASRSAEVLEQGSLPTNVIVFKFPGATNAIAFWEDSSQQEIFSEAFNEADILHVLSIQGIPDQGLPGDATPTVANVEIPEVDAPNAFMLIQGVMHDYGPITRYMETIIPLIKERGGVYRIRATSDAVDVLVGEWRQHALVFSEWPSVEAAKDFWFCDTYQNVAIPLRRPASKFSVLLLSSNL